MNKKNGGRILGDVSLADMRRDALPHRRASRQVEFKFKDQQCIATLGYYDMEMTKLGEIFVNVGKKLDTDIDITARDMAISASIALQHGCTVDTLRKALTRDARGNPQSALGTLLDLIAGDPPRPDSETPPEPEPEPVDPSMPKPDAPAMERPVEQGEVAL